MGVDRFIYPIYHYLLMTCHQPPLYEAEIVNSLIFLKSITFFFSLINLHYLSDIFTDI